MPFLVAVWALLFSDIAAADSIVRVTVRAKGSGDVIPRAEARVGGNVIYSDPKGEFDFAVPDTGDGSVEVYRTGYKSLTIPFADLRGKSTYDAFLYPGTPRDDEVIVTGTRRPETSRITISVEEAEKVAPGGDPAQIPKLLPGVQTQTFQSEVIIRGSGPNDSRYYVDGFEVPFIFHRFADLSVMPSQLLSEVEFSSGGFGSQFGNATGGIVTLKTKSQLITKPKFEFRVNVPSYSAVYYETPIDDSSMFATSVRRSYLEYFLTPILEEMASDSLTVIPYFGDAHAYYYKQTSDGHHKVIAISSLDGLEVSAALEVSDKEDGRGTFSSRSLFHTLSYERLKRLNDSWTLSATPSLKFTTFTNTILDNYFNIDILSGSLRAELTRRLNRTDKFYIGIETENAWADVEVLAPRPDPSDPFFDFEEAPKVKSNVVNRNFNFAGWVSLEQKIGDRLSVMPGLRTFYEDSIEETAVDPRFNGRLDIGGDSALKSSAGIYSQAPQIQDTTEDFGNPDITFIRANHYGLGVETKWGDRWLTDFQVFHKDLYDTVKNGSRFVDNSGSGYSTGLEVFIRRNRTERFFGWVAYTYSVNRDRDDAFETFAHSQYDQTHILNVTGNYKLTGTWDVGGRAKYNTGSTFTPVDDAVYNANLDKYQPRTAATTRNFSARLPDYNEINVYSNWDFLFDTWKMGLKLGLEYIALGPKAVQQQYNYDYSKSEYFVLPGPIPYIEFGGVL